MLNTNNIFIFNHLTKYDLGSVVGLEVMAVGARGWLEVMVVGGVVVTTWVARGVGGVMVGGDGGVVVGWEAFDSLANYEIPNSTNPIFNLNKVNMEDGKPKPKTTTHAFTNILARKPSFASIVHGPNSKDEAPTSTNIQSISLKDQDVVSIDDSSRVLLVKLKEVDTVQSERGGDREKFSNIDRSVKGYVRFGDGSKVKIEGNGSITFVCKNGEKQISGGTFVGSRQEWKIAHEGESISKSIVSDSVKRSRAPLIIR
ncbi:hypothetical protein Tco_0335333 [Tanacetum coccineum]